MTVDRITTVSELFGFVLVSIGAGLIFFPAGLIVAGLSLIVAGALAGRP